MQLQLPALSSPAAFGLQQRRSIRLGVRTRAAAPSTSTPPLSAAPLIKLPEGAKDVPVSPGVYAVYDSNTTLQYIGLSRRVGCVVCSLFFIYVIGGERLSLACARHCELLVVMSGQLSCFPAGGCQHRQPHARVARLDLWRQGAVHDACHA